MLTGGLAAAGPLILIAFGLVPSAWLNRRGRRAARAGEALSWLAFVFALSAAVSKARHGTADWSWPAPAAVCLGVYFDNLSAIVALLVAFLLAIVARFAVNYLAGDPNQGRFTKWLLLTGGSVLVLVISGNLVQFAVAWSATSWCLHQLLIFYRDRPGAILAARKKFIISRLGDGCLLAVIFLVFREFHTWDFGELFVAARNFQAHGLDGSRLSVNLICSLLVAGAMLKSAQFPFHSWLPDTMETPTPVSALMHAGIINAGGFLVIRLNPLVTLSPTAMTALALVGAFTALFASLVMLTHASVKRALAFSTVAQMGFMMLECGLGAFGLAVLHLVAHSLYKAHAFLSSGSIVRLAKFAWTPTEKPAAHPLRLTIAFVAAVAGVAGCTWLLDGQNWRDPGQAMLIGTFAMALAYTLWNFWGGSLGPALVFSGVVFGGIMAGIYLGLHTVFNWLLGHAAWENSQLNSWPGAVLLATLLALFLLVLIIQTELPQWANRPFFQALYVHARNGFYFNTLANRAVAARWPVKPQASKKPLKS
jgi:NAD(P)H-quinone oxidoreductase subunit 5